MDFEAANRRYKSVRYGFGTAEFSIPVLDTKQHANRGERAHLSVCTGRTAVVQLHEFLGTIFKESVQYGFFFTVGCLEIRALALPWNSCHFFAAFSSSKKWKLSLLLLSLNLSISLGKNELSFGLFPPLESLSDWLTLPKINGGN